MTGLSRSLQLAEAGFERSVLKATDTTRLSLPYTPSPGIARGISEVSHQV